METREERVLRVLELDAIPTIETLDNEGGTFVVVGVIVSLIILAPTPFVCTALIHWMSSTLDVSYGVAIPIAVVGPVVIATVLIMSEYLWIRARLVKKRREVMNRDELSRARALLDEVRSSQGASSYRQAVSGSDAVSFLTSEAKELYMVNIRATRHWGAQAVTKSSYTGLALVATGKDAHMLLAFVVDGWASHKRTTRPEIDPNALATKLGWDALVGEFRSTLGLPVRKLSHDTQWTVGDIHVARFESLPRPFGVIWFDDDGAFADFVPFEQ